VAQRLAVTGIGEGDDDGHGDLGEERGRFVMIERPG
jgi:hypothetical protein